MEKPSNEQEKNISIKTFTSLMGMIEAKYGEGNENFWRDVINAYQAYLIVQRYIYSADKGIVFGTDIEGMRQKANLIESNKDLAIFMRIAYALFDRDKQDILEEMNGEESLRAQAIQSLGKSASDREIETYIYHLKATPGDARKLWLSATFGIAVEDIDNLTL